jgi:hypothetical protein
MLPPLIITRGQRVKKMGISDQGDPVSAIREDEATETIATIFADIRETLNVEVVNLVWRHLATMPGALEWVWGTLKPLYKGPAIVKAVLVHQNLNLPRVPRLSRDVLTAAGLDDAALASIFAILDSYQHTNALALVCFSALLARFEGSARRPDVSSAPQRNEVGPIRRVALPRLAPIAEMPPATARLVHELNGFGEDSDFALVASMYRHLSYWPTYLALIRTLLVPLHESGELMSLVAEARILGWEYGRDLASDVPPPPQEVEPVLAAVRRFVRHPIARMTGVCSLVRRATMDESESQPVRG